MSNWKTRFLAVVMLGLVAGIVLTLAFNQPAHAVGDKGAGGAAGGPAYTVVMTEGHNLIVTDNKSNILYFYTIDKEAEIGSDLKLRGSLDLTQVGKAVIRPSRQRSKFRRFVRIGRGRQVAGDLPPRLSKQIGETP